MHGHQPHPVTSGTVIALSDHFPAKKGKRRGNYSCGRCGQPKKGHVCHVTDPLVADSSSFAVTPVDSSNSSATMTVVLDADSPVCFAREVKRRKAYSNLRRALSFDDVDVRELPDSDDEGGDEEEEIADVEVDIGSGKLPVSCLWEVMRRLPPASLLSAAKVCTGWRDATRRIWRAADEEGSSDDSGRICWIGFAEMSCAC